MNATSMRRAAIGAALLVSMFAPAGVAAPEGVEIAAALGPGTRVHRELLQRVTLKVDRSGRPPLTFQMNRTIDMLADIVSADRVRAEFPRAVTISTAASGEERPEGVTTADPMRGATLRYDRDDAARDDAWKAQPVAGPTPKSLTDYLTMVRGDPLRRPFAPTGSISPEAVITLPAASFTNALRDALPVRFVSAESATLALDAGKSRSDPAVAVLFGDVTATLSIRVPTFQAKECAVDLSIRSEVVRASGLVRSLRIQGERKIDVEAGARKAQVTVTIDVTETANRQPADWEYERPPGASQPVPTLKPIFDPRDWQVIHHAQGSSANPASLTEWSLGDVQLRKGTEQGWTELVTVHRHPYSDGPPPVDRFYEMKRDEVLRAAPSAQWTVVRKSPNRLDYEWTLAGSQRYSAQHELGRLVRLGDVMLQIRYTRKVAKLPPGDRLAWLRRLRSAKVIHPR